MRLFTTLAFSGLLASSLASADTLTLKSGETYQGTYLGGSARQIRMDLNGDIRTFDVDRIRSVTFQNDSDSGAPPPRSSSGRYGDAQRDSDAPRLRRLDQGTSPDYSAKSRNSGSYNNAGSPSNGPIGVTLDPGTSITVRMIDPVDSDTARLGQTFRASIDEPVSVGDRVVIPRGADVLTKLVSDQQSGRIQGRTVLSLAIMNIMVNGQPVDVTTSDVQTASASRTKRSAGVIGGGTALGAIIGGIAGGGRGAAIGAASGAAAGTGAEVLTGGQRVKIPSETRLTFRLQSPVQL